MWKFIYHYLLKPRAASEDARRKELILNILLLGVLVLSSALFASATISLFTRVTAYTGASLLVQASIFLVFLMLFIASRKGHYRPAAYLFVGLFTVFSLYPVAYWGILLPQGILSLSLLIVMSGVLLSSRSAFWVTLLLTVALLTIKYLEVAGTLQFDTTWMGQTGGYNDVIAYGVTFLIVALVSWLSNREIERSLQRARNSERELRNERNLLEIKVKERTRELEKAQVEKMLELNRFAEFGRVSSSLLHELANPLTSMSINLEQLETNQHSNLVKQVRESITYMEQYVDSARRQLRKQSESKIIDIAEEIRRVDAFMEPKARTRHIKTDLQLAEGLQLMGDSVRFDQIIANLLVNAMDAYNDKPKAKSKRVVVTAKKQARTVIITVQDFGAGITKAELGRVFEPFYTTKSAERGTGLGLTITKRAVEEDFQGTIRVTSSPKTGTCFTIKLPLI